MKKLLFVLITGIILLNLKLVNAQNVAITDSSGYNANSSAMLDVCSFSKGLLIPRADTANISNPAKGLLVCDTTGSEVIFYFYDGSRWIDIATSGGGTDSIWVEDLTDSIIYMRNSYNKLGIGVDTPYAKAEIMGDTILNKTDTIPLFVVRDKDGKEVFVVYPKGVFIFVDTLDNSSKALTNDQPTGFRVGKKTIGSTKDFDEEYFSVSPATAADTIDPSEARVLWYPKKEAFMAGRVLVEGVDSVGTNSWASGFESKSIGDYSQALGYQAIARGDYSTAIGNGAVADGDNSYALGDSTWAGGGGGAKGIAHNCYAFGKKSEATGDGSYAFGKSAISTGESSFALGDSTESTKNNSYAFGRKAYAFGNSSFAFGDSLTAGTDTTGNAFAFGKGAKATGEMSYALGKDAHASGYLSFVLGDSSIATNNNSYAIGKKTQATGVKSIAFGEMTKASGSNSTAFGFQTEASGELSFASGSNSIASGYISTAIGGYCNASEAYSLAMGYSSNAMAPFSISIGSESNTHAPNSLALGMGAVSWGDASTAIGMAAEALADGAMSFGTNSVASGSYSLALGDEAHADNYNSIALGKNAWAESEASIAIGNQAWASGRYSMALGSYQVKSGGFASTAIGYMTTSFSAHETVIGCNNTSYTPGSTTNWNANDRLFVVGNGEPEPSSTPSNAMTILKNGKVGIGVSTPSTILHIEQAGNTFVRISSSDANMAGIELFRQGSGSADWRINNSGGTIYFERSTDDLASSQPLFAFGNSYFRPYNDNFSSLGGSSNRWTTVYAVNGTINTSDKKEKKNIKEINYGLNEVLKLKPVSFAWKNDSLNKTKLGFIAQDVENIINEVVIKEVKEIPVDKSNPNADENYSYGLYYSDFIPVLVKAIQEQQTLIQELQKENKEIKAALDKIKNKVENNRQNDIKINSEKRHINNN